jgi:nucleotide-binding universal stress UspA family protein
MNDTRILLAVSTSRYSQHLVDLAMKEAERLASTGPVAIDVLYILEQEDLQHISKRVGDQGFLGLSTTADVMSTLGAEHHRMALLRIDEVKAAAATQGFPVSVLEVTGRFVESVLKQAAEAHYETILITRADRPFVSRILFGSEADRVARMVQKEGLGHVIIDEDE